MKKLVTLLFIIFFLPIHVHASGGVIINEIAWMGNENSANDEWMELKNEGSESISLEGWLLESQDGSPKIELSGTIDAGGFFLLERSDDESVLGVSADLVYTGALSNSGEVLVLKDLVGSEADRADGSNSWELLGGDNNTKESAQKTQSGWITATGTPKAENSEESTPEEIIEEEEESEETSFEEIVKYGGSSNNVFVMSDAGGNIVAGLGQKIFFDASDSKGENLTYSWNMGNGEMVNEKDFLYKYQFPGKYLVTLFVESGMHKSQDQIEVTIYPSDIFISEFFSGFGESSGWVEVYNSSENFIEFSGWSLAGEEGVFVIPEGTFIGAGEYLVFSEDILGFDIAREEGELFLLYPNGQASDKVDYIFEDEEFSASRKNTEEFVWTKNRTPGFANVVTFSDDSGNFYESSTKINQDQGILRTLVKENWASFIKIGGEKSFLINPAYAKVAGVELEAERQNSDFFSGEDLSASLVNTFSGDFIFGALVSLIALLSAFWIGRRFK